MYGFAERKIYGVATVEARSGDFLLIDNEANIRQIYTFSINANGYNFADFAVAQAIFERKLYAAAIDIFEAVEVVKLL
jgi:hypothetical protein